MIYNAEETEENLTTTNIDHFAKWSCEALQKLSLHINFLRSFLFDIDEHMFLFSRIADKVILILNQCWSSLQQNIVVFIDLVMVLAYEKLIEFNNAILARFQTNLIQKRLLYILDHVQKSVISYKSNELQLYLNLLIAYYSFICQCKMDLCQDYKLIENIINTVITVIQLHYPPQLLEVNDKQSAYVDFNNLQDEYCVHKFKYVHDGKLIIKLKQFLKILINEQTIQDVTDILCERDENINEVTLFYIYLYEADECFTEKMSESCIEEYLKDRHWYLETGAKDNGRISSKELSFNVVHICLTIELSFWFLKAHQKNTLLILKIYSKIVEKIQDTNVAISTAAMLVMKRISLETKSTSPQLHLAKYSDTLLPKVMASMKINKSNSLSVIDIFVQLADSTSNRELLRDIIERSLDIIMTAETFNQVYILNLIKKALFKLDLNFPVDDKKQLNSFELKNEWCSFYYESNDEIQDEIQDDEQITEMIPNDETFFQEIITRIVNLLYSSNLNVKLVTLRIMYQCFKNMQNESLIFQTAHKLWPYLVYAIEDENYVVVIESYILLEILAVKCKNFIEEKTIHKIIPTTLKKVQQIITVDKTR